jgi:hypothetical protein
LVEAVGDVTEPRLVLLVALEVVLGIRVQAEPAGQELRGKAILVVATI